MLGPDVYCSCLGHAKAFPAIVVLASISHLSASPNSNFPLQNRQHLQNPLLGSYKHPTSKNPRAMLDSSPVALPSIPRPLKRSASTASLPTPPRTHRRHARGTSRGSCDSDSDENVVLSSDDEDREGESRGALNKKRRMGETNAADANEEAFWLGDSSTGVASSSSTKNDTSSKAPLLYRRLQAQAQMDVAPVSPPPSHRKVAVVTPQATSPPSTPRTRSATKRALFDSPNNPFVSTPQKVVDDSDTPSPSASSANPSPRTPKTSEKPTITYVL